MNPANPSTTSATRDHIARLIDGGRPDLAAAEAKAARTRFPHDAELARLHAIALLRLGRLDEAHAMLLDAQSLAPRSIEVLGPLGSVLLARGDTLGAIRLLESALDLAPNHPAILNTLGNAYLTAGDPQRAHAVYVSATRAAPDHVNAWLNLAGAELVLGDAAAAERIARHALTLAPEYPETVFLLGHALAAQRRYAEAEAAYAIGARCAPQDARFPYQCGLMAEECKHLAAAAHAHERALALDPNLDRALGQIVFLRRQMCEWDALDAWSSRLRACVAAGKAGIAPFGFLAEPACAAEQLHCARTYALGIRGGTAMLRQRIPFAHPQGRPDAPLKVGFVASGLGNHPTALLVVAMLEALREHAIEIHLFSTAPDEPGEIPRRLHAAAHNWHAYAGTTPAALACGIHAAMIEVLIDLDGYCGGGLPEALALRPAPVQVNWLAYPGTLAAPWIDYVIADRVVLPESLRAHFTEHVLWLPRCFQPSDPTRSVGAPPSRAACGLPENGVVYACFNNSYKINPHGFERMLAVLRAVPHSVLWLLDGPEGANERLCQHAAHGGVDPARLVFAPKVAHLDHLARHRYADLFLDTTPYNAHTTASDAIWAGCPVLTVPGETFAARVAASLNHHLGMRQLNLRDDTAFVDFAVRIGSDATLRDALHAQLADRRVHSGLFDMRAFAADFAEALQWMAARHRAGLAPVDR
ncbi:MAG: tetratricopeptide repeat protein [Rhodanobacter sp.]|nr:tetratricopeptide repeat protein [Rhodanobacter sp.]